ncbi:MAG: hypothetical protein Kow0037_11000 [Calditrichia bacterium]
MPKTLQVGIKDRLIGWSIFNSVVMLVGSLLSIITGALDLLAIGAVISFLALVALGKNHWTPASHFGTGNSITAVRLAGVWLLCYLGANLPPLAVFAIAATVLLLDGVDGLVARKRHEISDFGEFWDKETDAFLMLVLSARIYLQGLGPAWLLVMGLMRYIFGIYVFLLKPPAKTERRSRRGRWIYVFSVAILLSYFLPLPAWRDLPAGIAVLALLYSFGRDMLWMLRQKFSF